MKTMPFVILSYKGICTQVDLADTGSIAELFRFAYQDHEAAGLLAEGFAAKIPGREFSRLR